MPKIFIKLLKISLLLRLSVFIDLACFSLYFLILCFVLSNTWVQHWYSLRNTGFLQKQSVFLFNYKKVENNYLKKVTRNLLIFEAMQIYLICILNFSQSLKKSLKYPFKVFKRSMDILKSIQKQSKALKIWSSYLHNHSFLRHFCTFTNRILTL